MFKHLSIRWRFTILSVLLISITFALIENAIKYNNDNGFVKINVNNKKNKIVIEIIDNDVGTEGEMKKHIFEPFYRIN